MRILPWQRGMLIDSWGKSALAGSYHCIDSLIKWLVYTINHVDVYNLVHAWLLAVFVYWVCLIICCVRVLSMLDYLLCSCIEYAWLLAVFVYWVCLITCCVRVSSMLDYLLCSCIEFAWLFAVFVYWVCLIICCIRVLSMLIYLLYSCIEYAWLLAVFVYWVCLILLMNSYWKMSRQIWDWTLKLYIYYVNSLFLF